MIANFILDGEEDTILDSYYYRGFDIEILACLYTDNLPRYWSRFKRPTDKYRYNNGVWEQNQQIVYRQTLIRIDWLLDMAETGKAVTCQPIDFALFEEWEKALGE